MIPTLLIYGDFIVLKTSPRPQILAVKLPLRHALRHQPLDSTEAGAVFDS